MGLLTVLAASLLILAVVLGIRAGQYQVELQGRQDAAVALSDAIDLHAQGDFQAALDAYKHVLQLEPDNLAAREGIENVLAQMASGPAPVPAVATPIAVITNTTSTSTPPVTGAVVTPPAAGSPAPTPQAATSTEALFSAATAAYGAGRWQEAISRLVALTQADANYEREQVTTMLFESYVNLATEKDNEDNLEEALTYYDRALQLRPNDLSARSERELIAKYLDMLTYLGADWARAITLLRELYAEEPDYRDVAERLQTALVSYGDSLASTDPCLATEQYTAAANLAITPGLIVKRDDSQLLCEEGGPLTTTIDGTPLAIRPGEDAATDSTAAGSSVASVSSNGLRGRILYSSYALDTGRSFIAAQAIGAATPVILQDDGIQPTLRSDGQRLLFRSVRSDLGGLAALDPSTGLLLRFTQYPEDAMPSWNPQGNRLVFASNREGDRLWRIYATWAEADAETTNLGFGDAPAWSPTSDQIAFRGCDVTGNACGIWMINSSGGDRVPLTTSPADNRPAWSPNGRYVVFMSDGRDGNMEIYRADVNTGQVVRLTENPALDALPAVSPDGRWVAFVSNRDGSWKIWYVSIDGGAANLLTPITGDFRNWSDHALQWVN